MNSPITWYIFDLDGTLYDFGWCRFHESVLWDATRKWFYEIIKTHNLGNPEQLYQSMVEKEWQEKIGTSQQLADLIGKTRAEVLQEIWGSISPSWVIQNYKWAKLVLPELARYKKLFIVTAAPKVWADNALEYMRIKHYFQIILTLEDYWSSKREAFLQIHADTWIPFDQLISIWDQEHSDIAPAKILGMQTLHVGSPLDLIKLL